MATETTIHDDESASLKLVTEPQLIPGSTLREMPVVDEPIGLNERRVFAVACREGIWTDTHIPGAAILYATSDGRLAIEVQERRAGVSSLDHPRVWVAETDALRSIESPTARSLVRDGLQQHPELNGGDWIIEAGDDGVIIE